MKIEFSRPYFYKINRAIKQYRLRHGPYNKANDRYRIYLYPDKKHSLFLIQISDTDISIVD